MPTMIMVETKKPEKKPKATKRKYTRTKKPKDKPKRPLSAYNCFFREERTRILNIINNDESTENSSESNNYIGPEALSKVKTSAGKAVFPEMAKLIGIHWKNIAEEQSKRYSEMAAIDSARYKKEMVVYNTRKEESRMKSREIEIEPEPNFSNWVPGPTTEAYHAHHGYQGESNGNVAAPTPRYPQPHYGGSYGYHYDGMNSAPGRSYGPPEGNSNAYYEGSGASHPNDAYGGYWHGGRGEAPGSGEQGTQGPSFDQSRNDSPHGHGPSGSCYYGDRGGSPYYYQHPHGAYEAYHHHQQQQYHHHHQQQQYHHQQAHDEQHQRRQQQAYNKQQQRGHDEESHQKQQQPYDEQSYQGQIKQEQYHQQVPHDEQYYEGQIKQEQELQEPHDEQSYRGQIKQEQEQTHDEES